MKRASYIIMTIIQILLPLLLIGFASVPLSLSDVRTINNAGLQRVRVERMTKDVLILAYRPSGERVQAVNEIQLTLPAWKQTQIGLQKGDISLGFPSHETETYQVLVTSENAAYAAITASLSVIIAHPEAKVDPIQLNIILQNERSYLLSQTDIVMLLAQQAEDRKLHLLVFQSFIACMIIALSLISSRMDVQRAQKKEEKKNGSTTNPIS